MDTVEIVFTIIGILFPVILFILLINKIPSKGEHGERNVNKHLLTLLKSDREYLISNLLIPNLRSKLGKTEVDCLFITRKGIFCIETKYWGGYIVGKDEDEYWSNQLGYDEDDINPELFHKHRNPVKQNYGHCIAIKELLNNRFFVENIVILYKYEGGEISSSSTYTLEAFDKYYESLADKLNDFEVNLAYNSLLTYKASKSEIRKFRKDMRQVNFKERD